MDLLRRQINPAAELTQNSIASVINFEAKLAAPQRLGFLKVGIVLPGFRHYDLEVYSRLYI